MYFSALKDLFQKMWAWLEYYKGYNIRNSQLYTKIIWWKALVIIKLCKFLSHTNQLKLSIREIFASRCANFNSLFSRLSFSSVTCYCPIQQPVLCDLFLRAGSSTCSFDLTRKTKQIKASSSKYFNQIDFPLALDSFCLPTPWIWRPRCKMPLDTPKRSQRQQW